MNIGDVINLKGISRHGKNRIAENGTEWKIIGIHEIVGFSNFKLGWLQLKSIKTGDVRIIREKGDQNFVIVD